MISKKFGRRVFSISLILLFNAACGSEPSSEDAESASHSESITQLSSVANPGLMGSTAAVTVQYRFDPAKPVIMDGRPILTHRLWSCLDTVKVTFAQPMRLGTLLGNVIVRGAYGDRHPLYLANVGADFKSFQWQSTSEGLCNSNAKPTELVFESDIWMMNGKLNNTGQSFALNFPPNRDVNPPGNVIATLSPARSLSGTSGSVSSSTSASSPLCKGASAFCFSVTPARLNKALSEWTAWEKAERSQAIYDADRLKIMPLEFLLQPFVDANRRRQFGSLDTLYVLRRAARFVQLLFPDLRQIPVGDLSEPDGSTPHSGDMALHPEGAHRAGRDVDVAYITVGSGNVPGGSYDWERNFWFLYGALKTTSVDLVLTAYKDTFVEMANKAFDMGLINGHAAGRFGALMQDSSLNHDKHLHIAVSNLENAGQTRRFTPSDDVYSCYLSLRQRSGNGAKNYCPR